MIWNEMEKNCKRGLITLINVKINHHRPAMREEC